MDNDIAQPIVGLIEKTCKSCILNEFQPEKNSQQHLGQFSKQRKTK